MHAMHLERWDDTTDHTCILWKVPNSSYCITINVAIFRHFPDLVEFVRFSDTIRVASRRAECKNICILTYRGISRAGFHENTDSICIF